MEFTIVHSSNSCTWEWSNKLNKFEEYVRQLKIKLYVWTYLKLENHLTSCAVLFLLNLMSGKYIFSTDDDGYLVQKNISLAFRRCIGVNVELFTVVKEIFCVLKKKKKKKAFTCIILKLNICFLCCNSLRYQIG